MPNKKASKSPKPTKTRKPKAVASSPHPIVKLTCLDGYVIIFGDAHYDPRDKPTTAHRALIHFIQKYKPKHVIMNGDAIDASSISRWGRIMWEEHPLLLDELEVCQERLAEVERAAPSACSLTYTIGNHDLRFCGKLSNTVPQYQGIPGFALSDHFPNWNFTWSVQLNDDVIVKHRFKGGAHAQYNNIIHSGMSMINGHLHAAQVRPFTDWRGTRYGVDHGCLADPQGKFFMSYTENGVKNWRSGFCLATFKSGKLLLPELCLVYDEAAGVVQWRGELLSV